jgi:hypothetical protein
VFGQLGDMPRGAAQVFAVADEEREHSSRLLGHTLHGAEHGSTVPRQREQLDTRRVDVALAATRARKVMRSCCHHTSATISA